MAAITPPLITLTSFPQNIGASKALYFNGIFDMVDFSNDNSFKLDNGTYSSFFKIRQITNGDATFTSVFLKYGAYGWFVINGILTLYDFFSATVTSTGINVADDNWHNLTQSFQSTVTNGTLTYLDGVLVATSTMTIGNQFVALRAGSYGLNTASGAGASAIDGQICGCRLWNTLLTQADVTNLSLGVVQQTGLIGEWLFQEGSGITATDTSTGGHNGTIKGPFYTQANTNYI